MKKTIFASVLCLALLFTFGVVAKAEMAKEGTFSGKIVVSCTLDKTIAMGEERFQLSYECMGVHLNDSGEGFLHKASIRMLGAMHAVKGIYEYERSFSFFKDPDGDQVFFTHDAKGSIQSAQATVKWVGGTGKYQGVTGGGEWTWVAVAPAAEGTAQGCMELKGHWKLP